MFLPGARRLWLAAAFWALHLASVPLGAAEIHVRPGESFEAAAESLGPGDTLVVHSGTYRHGTALFISVSGTEAEPVLIRGADGGPPPVIELTAAGHNVITIDGASHLTIRGLAITANGIAGADGINLRGASSYVALEDLEIHDISVGINFRSSMHHIVARRNHIFNTNDTGEGIYIGCHEGDCAVTDSIIENNWIHNTTDADQGDGIEIKRGSHSNIIRDNVIHDTRYPCIIAYGTDGGDSNIIERNVVWNCADAAVQVAADAVIRNNILIPGSGIGFASGYHAGVTPNNVQFVHNTIVGGRLCVNLRSWSNRSDMVFANNAVYCGSDRYKMRNLEGVDITGNVFEPLPALVSTKGNTAGRSADDDMVDVDNRNVFPTSDSALIAAGNIVHVTGTDFNGTPRRGAADAGAYVSAAKGNPGWSVGPGFKDAGAPDADSIYDAGPDGVSLHDQSMLRWRSQNVARDAASEAR